MHMYLFIVWGYKQFNNNCFNNNSLKSIFLSGQQDASYRRKQKGNTQKQTHAHTQADWRRRSVPKAAFFFLSRTLKLPSLRIGLVGPPLVVLLVKTSTSPIAARLFASLLPRRFLCTCIKHCFIVLRNFGSHIVRTVHLVSDLADVSGGTFIPKLLQGLGWILPRVKKWWKL